MMTSITKALAIGFFLIMVSLSLNYNIIPKLLNYDTKRTLQLAVLFSTLCWHIFLKSNRCEPYTVNHYKDYIYPILLILFAIASACQSPSPRHATLELTTFAGLFYLTLFTANQWIIHNWLMLRVLVYSILLGAGLYMIGFYTGYLASFLERIPLVWPEPFFGFSNVRAFNQYQLWTMGLIYLPFLAFNLSRSVLRRCLYALIIGWWILLFASTSRGVLLAWVIAMVTIISIYQKTALPFVRLQMTGFTIGLLGYLLLFNLIPSLLAGGIDSQTIIRDNTNDRIELWKKAYSMIQSHPWLGVGPMHYAWYPNPLATHPHNSLLQFAAEWGLPETILVVIIFGHCVYCWLKQFNINTLQSLESSKSHLIVTLSFTLSSCTYYSLVDGVIVMPMSQTMLAVLSGLMLGVYIDNRPHISQKPHKYYLRKLFAALTLTGLVWSVLPELLPRILGNTTMIPIGYQAIGPRFWQEGGISHR